MKVLLLQVYESSCKELHELTKKSCIDYCEYNKMDYMAVNLDDLDVQYKVGSVMLKKLHPAWAKLWLLDYINYSKYDYVWVLDIDVIILNKAIDVRMYLPNRSFLMPTDDSKKIICSVNGDNGGSLLNTGSIIYSKDSIRMILNELNDYLSKNNYFDLNRAFWEQDFINYYRDEKPQFFIVLPMTDINSWWLNYSPSQLLFHFMARSYDEKLEVARQILNQFPHLK